MKSKILLINLFWGLVFSVYGYAGTAIEQKSAITEAMHRQCDQPDQTIEVPAIVIEHDFAIVDWILGGRGGRALLKYAAEHQWQVFVCGGARLTDIAELQHTGISLPVTLQTNGFYAGPNIEWSPSRYYADNTNATTVDRYILLNVRLGYMQAKGWSGYLEGRNLTDRRYVANVAIAGAADPTMELFNPGTSRAVYAGAI